MDFFKTDIAGDQICFKKFLYRLMAMKTDSIGRTVFIVKNFSRFKVVLPLDNPFFNQFGVVV